MASSIKVEGSCNCGSINYIASGPIIKRVLCQCVICRKSTGSMFSSYTQFKESDIEILDPSSVLRTWRDFDAASETKFSRSFCSNCGSALFAANETLFPGFLGVSVGTLSAEYQETWKPDVEICRKNSTTWLLEGLGKANWTAFQTYPPPA